MSWHQVASISLGLAAVAGFVFYWFGYFHGHGDSHDSWMETVGTPAPKPVALTIPEDILDRVRAAEQRIRDGHGPMRIPPDPTDVDVVLHDVRTLLEGSYRPLLGASQ